MLQSATVSLGLIGAGTNNARIAGMLRNLSSYYYKDPSLLFCVRLYPFCILLLIFSFLQNNFLFETTIPYILMSLQVRIAQGLVHMGKGLLTLNPYHSDRFLLSK